jgi:DNA-binding XRE family transcriptional regulator
MSQKKDIILEAQTQDLPEDVVKQTMTPESEDRGLSDSQKDGAEKAKSANESSKKENHVSAPVDEQSGSRKKSKEPPTINNKLREFRIEQMMSKAELARKAGLSVLTIDRIEKGFGCRMDTKRKILKALGLKLSDRRKLFQED